MVALAAILPILGTVATIAGTAISAMGQIAAGKAAAARGAQQREVARFQAEQGRRQGKLAFRNAQERSKQRREQLRFALARQEAVDAAGGFDPAGVGAQARGEALFKAGTLAAFNEIDSGFIKRQQLETGATIRELEGDAAFQAGQTQQSAFNTAAFGTVIGGVQTLTGQFAQRSFQQQQLAALSSQGGVGSSNIFNNSIFRPTITDNSSISSRFG